MVDRNLQNFYKRLGRIEDIHDHGGGFEATGAVGMSHYSARKRKSRRFGVLGPLVLVMLAILMLKSAILATVGQDVYERRLTELREGSPVEQVGAFVLQPDRVTIVIAEKMRSLLY